MDKIFVLAVFIALFLTQIACCGQHSNAKPEIGKSMPRYLLSNVHHLDAKTVDNDTFQGKWLILYFWSLGCKGSVQALEQMDVIQRSFPEDIQVVAIGQSSGEINSGIDVVFDRLKGNRGYIIPTAYDSVLIHKWDIETVPHIYIIDQRGILRYITNGSDMTIRKIQSLLDGESVTFEPKTGEGDWRSTSGKNILNNEIPLSRMPYVAVLTEWAGEKPLLGFEFDRYASLPDQYHREGWTITKASLKVLYAYGYFGRAYWIARDTTFYGKVWHEPILDVHDPLPFLKDYNCYIKLPMGKNDLENMERTLQQTLEMAFGYHVSLEVREFPVWKLVAKPGAKEKLRSKGGQPRFEGHHPILGVAVRNYSTKDFLRLVTSSISHAEDLVFLDETNIEFGIDVAVETDMTDLFCIRQSLRDYGLDLVRETKPMQVLVIRDKIN